MKKLLLLSLVSFSVSAGDITFQFKSPSFNGQGTSPHYLTIENQETSRKEAIAKKLEDELKAAIAAENNSTVNRFLKNVESRIYAELSRQLVTNLFAEGATGSGSLNLQGYNINYQSTVDENGTEVLKLVITNLTDPTDVTSVTIPISGFCCFG